ncbi:hypothetical protein [Rhizobium sp. CAU 1783]
MLYILRNHNRLDIAWNGNAPKTQTTARWEVLMPRRGSTVLERLRRIGE